jgi:uncharacterized protein (DUF111 family)
MKKGRPGIRVEVLARPADADRLETLLLQRTPTIGARRWAVERRALERREATVDVSGEPVRVKIVVTPDGTRRAKPEHDDVRAAAARLGADPADVARRALAAAEGAKSV